MPFRFQSTLPARGATEGGGKKWGDALISIHAPRTGSDSDRWQIYHNCQAFQSTLPARGATMRFSRSMKKQVFQSTLPARGATPQYLSNRGGYHISIHAPRTGSDFDILTFVAHAQYFNPRSPHGERPRGIKCIVCSQQFQSTLPARGATSALCTRQFQQRFQSTLPARGATVNLFQHQRNLVISIHAPRTGSELSDVAKGRKRPRISIHAPRTGSDTTFSPACQVVFYFNPRSPHGERRCRVFLIFRCVKHFNPRSPHGERQTVSFCAS